MSALPLGEWLLTFTRTGQKYMLFRPVFTRYCCCFLFLFNRWHHISSQQLLYWPWPRCSYSPFYSLVRFFVKQVSVASMLSDQFPVNIEISLKKASVSTKTVPCRSQFIMMSFLLILTIEVTSGSKLAWPTMKVIFRGLTQLMFIRFCCKCYTTGPSTSVAVVYLLVADISGNISLVRLCAVQFNNYLTAL